MAKKPGPEGWQPSPKEKEQIRNLALAGAPLKVIAKIIGKTDKTITKHCRDILELANAEVNGMVVGQLLKKIMKGDTVSILFWCKTRMGWRENSQINLEAGEQLKPLLLNLAKVNEPEPPK